MNILVIGGTRFIGPYVVRELHEAGHRVTVFHRGKSPVELPEDIEHIIGDRNKLYNFRDAFTQLHIDAVIDMILITEQHAHALVETCSGIVDHIIGISSQDVYRAYGIMLGKEKGNLQPTPLSEDADVRSALYPYRGETPRPDDDPRKLLDDYDKIPIEKILMQEKDVSGTVMRLPMVYGPGDYQHRLFEYIKRIDDHRPIILMHQGLAQWKSSFGYVENVAHAICCAVHNRKAHQRIYNVADRKTMTQETWVQKIASITGWNGTIKVLPSNALPQHVQPGFNTAQDLDVSTERIRSELGYKEPVSLDRALAITIDWERRNPPEQIDPNQYDYKKEDKAVKDYEQSTI